MKPYYSHEPILTTYRVNYMRGLPGKDKFIRSIQMSLTVNGFLFRKNGFELYIHYGKVAKFEIVKGAGSFWGTNLVMDNVIAKLFEITYFDDYNRQICVRFEMYASTSFGHKNASACAELLRFIRNNGILDKFIPAPQVISTSIFPDIPSQIEKLAELHKSGILTDEEFQTKKSELLKRL